MNKDEVIIINSQIARMKDALITFNQWFDDCIIQLHKQLDLRNKAESE